MKQQPALFNESAFGTYTARAPHNGTAASREGAQSVAEHVERQMGRILAAVRLAGSTGLTNQEIAERCGIGQSAVCGRTNTLRDAGLIRLASERRCSRFRDGSRSSIRHQVWLAAEVSH